jgi:hypothetical protein
VTIGNNLAEGEVLFLDDSAMSRRRHRACGNQIELVVLPDNPPMREAVGKGSWVTSPGNNGRRRRRVAGSLARVSHDRRPECSLPTSR